MNRREFLTLSALGGIAAAAQNINAQMMKPRISLPFGYKEATFADLQRVMSSGENTSEGIVAAYLKRIGLVDKQLNSIIELNPDAVAIAKSLDAERKKGNIRGPLHGVPILIKDNIDTADKMKTTAGSLALVDAPTPKQDAFLVKKLRDAGAVILGKTNLSEWANFRSTSSSSGWSGRGGQTNNPYDITRNACGSSSGSGVSVSANLAAAAIGTETDGSILCPSATCGIVGLKPTLGLISRSGVIPIAHSQDTAGPMARTVTDAAILLGAMVGTDKNDAITADASKGFSDYTKFLQKDGLRGMRIGVARQYWGRSRKLDAAMEPILKALKDAGAVLVDIEFKRLRDFGSAEYEVLLYEFKEDLNKYLARRGGMHKTIADLIEFNNKNADKELQYFGQEIFLAANAKGDLNSKEYKDALALSKQSTQPEGIDAVVNEHKLSAIFAPSGGLAWKTDLTNGDCGVFESSSIAAVAGYPNITVPGGFIDNLPFGVSFFGSAFSEPQILKAAFAFEQLTNARRAPMI